MISSLGLLTVMAGAAMALFARVDGQVESYGVGLVLIGIFVTLTGLAVGA